MNALLVLRNYYLISAFQDRISREFIGYCIAYFFTAINGKPLADFKL